MKITNYDEQYKKAHDQMLEAIQNNQNVVLWGSGYNGKTHLTNELRDNDPDLCKNYYRIFNVVGLDLHKKFILECTNINTVLNDFKDYSFVFINMNEFKYSKN